MSKQRQSFCERLMMHGDAQRAALEAGYANKYSGSNLLKENDIKFYLAKLRKESSEKVMLTIEHKLNKLKNVIDTYIPDDQDELREAECKKVKIGLDAVDLSCKIQGDYAPEKTINVNANLEKDKVKLLISKYQKEY